jgi:hypothetical protein
MGLAGNPGLVLCLRAAESGLGLVTWAEGGLIFLNSYNFRKFCAWISIKDLEKKEKTLKACECV